jgi:FMN phosphatase YigB (HAD superfamily)
MRELSGKDLTDDQIASAWNALIIDLPKENVTLLEQLTKSHRIFLLSNTNCIHERCYREMIIKKYGSFIFDQLFEKSYLSHHLHMRKPDAEIFEYVLKDAGLIPAETLFIDDSPQHVEAAKKVGMHAVHLSGGTIRDIMTNV